MGTIKLLSVACFFLLLAAFKTLPLIFHLGTHIPFDPCDPLFSTWVLAWTAHATATDPGGLFDANIFYPVQRSLAFSDHLLGVLPLFVPFYFLTGNPVLGYNVLFLLSFALSGFGAFCLAYYWTGVFWPALVAGTLFGFAPFRLGQLSHLQLLNFFWAPLALVFLDRFLRARRWPDLAGFAVFYWLQVLASFSLANMISLAVVLYVGYYVLAVDRSLFCVAMIPKTLVFVGTSVGVLLPFYLPYLDVAYTWGASRSIDTVVDYSPDLVSFLTAPPLMNDLYEAVFKLLPGYAHEKWLFPGLVLPALALLGSCSTVAAPPSIEVRRLRRLFWLIAGVAVLVSLGPYLIVFGHKTRIPLPYLLLYHLVPGWTGMRVPGRFALLAVLAAIPLAALGAVKCSEVMGRWLGSGVWARFAPPLASAGLVCLFFLELGLKPLPVGKVPTGPEIPEVYRWLAAERPGPIVEIPFGQEDDYRYLYLSTVHWLPLVNGQTSFFPPTYDEIKETLAELPARAAVEYAGALGIRAIIVHSDKLSPLRLARWNASGTTAGGLRKLAAFGPDQVYSVPTVATASSLAGEIVSPDWLPAGKPVRAGLVLRAPNDRPWAHLKFHGRSDAVIEWHDPRTGESRRTSTQLRLPLVVRAGEAITIPVELHPPDKPGSYTFTVSSSGFAAKLRAIEVRDAVLATSQDSPRLLSASYLHHHGNGPVAVTAPDPIRLEITATNTGQAIWLAKTERNRGTVRLGWRWFKDGQELVDLSGRAPIRYDVFPGQRHRFPVVIHAPSKPGTYVLELSLVSEGLVWFFDVGTPPVRLEVNVRDTPTTVSEAPWLRPCRAFGPA